MAVFLNRANVAHPCDEAGELDSGGPSAVLFDVRHSAALDFEPFALGLPGWGRALAMTLLLAGSQAYSPVGAVLRHLDHPKLWGEEVHRRFFSAFRTRFSPELRALQRTEARTRCHPLPLLRIWAGTRRSTRTSQIAGPERPVSRNLPGATGQHTPPPSQTSFRNWRQPRPGPGSQAGSRRSRRALGKLHPLRHPWRAA